MSRKFKTIEFFGISGSGKSYIASIVKKKLENYKQKNSSTMHL